MATSSELLERIRTTARELGVARLTQSAFCAASGITASQILQHFDSWSDACRAAGIQCGPTGGENLKPNPRIDEATCIREMQRVAQMFGTQVLSKRDFDQHASSGSHTVCCRFGRWEHALQAAGLRKHKNHLDEIPLSVLAQDFLNTLVELHHIPTLRQVVRRSTHGLNTFSRKWDGWGNFKREAVRLLLSEKGVLADDVRSILEAEAGRLNLPEASQAQDTIAPFRIGRTLGFRAFAYAPTYEQEVVSLFSSVAEELGFEIITQRAAFPDCLARRRLPGPRKRFADCRIEFELRSRDFVTHGHPTNGCDLIVCWEHNWSEAPLEVLELQSAIRKLPGWR